MLWHANSLERFQSKMKSIFKATRQHSTNLAKYVTIYKAMMVLLKHLNGGKENSSDAFIAGVIGGYLVFGENNNVNQQIVLYVLARNMLGFAKMAYAQLEPQLSTKNAVAIQNRTWPIVAALTWGVVMFQFRHHYDVVQPSMRASMVYLYSKSDQWKNLKTLIWHND